MVKIDNNKGSKKEPPKRTGKAAGLEALALCSQLGLTLATPIVFGAVLGHWIDNKLGTRMLFLIILLIFGVFAGLMGAYNQVMNVTKRKNEMTDKNNDR